jgi:hypothetical protein
MAQIILSTEEIIGILAANRWIPQEVTALEAAGREIRLKVRTPLPLLKSLQVSAQFIAYESGIITFQFATNCVIDGFDAVVGRMLKSLHFEDYGGRWEYPRLYVAVNPLIRQRVRGVEIEDVVFQDGCFRIQTTTHPASGKAVTDKSAQVPRA